MDAQPAPRRPRPSALDGALEEIAHAEGVRLVDRVGTPKEHERFWSEYDWSKQGYEWGSRDYVQALLAPSLQIALKPGIRVLEIGVGAGRVTELLLGEGREVWMADISRKCLDQTLARFAGDPKLHALHIHDGTVEAGLPPASIDLVVSWDCFVHLDHATVATYLSHLHHLLRPGGYGLIHHADTRKAGGWRGDVNLATFIELLVDNDFIPLSHTRSVHEHADLLGHFDYLTFFVHGLRDRFTRRIAAARAQGFTDPATGIVPP